jgi:hypothetical protein
MSEQAEHEKQIALDLLRGIVSPEVLAIIEAVLDADLSEVKVEELIYDLRSVPKPTPCPTCGGSGQVQLPDISPVYPTDCPTCKGTGKKKRPLLEDDGNVSVC